MRITLRLAVVFLIAIISDVTAYAQDIHFSQFFNSPLTLSPSNTGNINGDFRLCGNYRSQWKEIAKPYLTQSVSFDKQFYLHTERISGGLVIINDQSGGHLKVNKFLLSAAYHKNLGGHNLHGGLQMGYVMKSFSLKDETFPNQLNWDKGQYDSQLPNYEVGLDERTSNIDLNWGVGWDKKITSKVEPFFSFALFHSHFPKETFFDAGKNHLKPRSLINAGVNIQVSKQVGVSPNLLLMNTVKASELLFGANVEYMLSEGENPFKRKAVYVGAFARNNTQIMTDAAYAVAGMKYNNWNIAISYDLNVSQLHTATDYRGAFEFSFIYTGISTHLSKTEIPCDRY